MTESAVLLIALTTLPVLLGILIVLFLEEKNHRLATVFYSILLGLSGILFLFGLWADLWIAGYNSGEFGGAFLIISGIVVFGIQLVLMVIVKDVKVRKILGITLMVTPILIIGLTFFVAGMLGIYVATD